MASKTAQTEYRRMLRKKNMGKKARRVRNNETFRATGVRR